MRLIFRGPCGRILPALTCWVMVLGCHIPSSSEPVPVQGNEAGRRLLIGEWNGRYWSEATNRHGTIQFTLAEKADTGYGEVEITFSPSLRIAHDAASPDPTKQGDEPLDPHTSTRIGISVVAIEADSVRGTMAPYWDPDCNCRARTVFQGKISGNQITGTFTSRRESSDRRLLTGEWRAEREHS
jgi:hypothetical protein